MDSDMASFSFRDFAEDLVVSDITAIAAILKMMPSPIKFAPNSTALA